MSWKLHKWAFPFFFFFPTKKKKSLLVRKKCFKVDLSIICIAFIYFERKYTSRSTIFFNSVFFFFFLLYSFPDSLSPMSGDQDDRWEALQKSLSIEENFTPILGGELQLPSLKQKEIKKVKKQPTSKPHLTQVKVKQTALTRPLFSDAELEKRIEKFREAENKTEDNVNIEGFLQDDDLNSESDDNCDDIFSITAALLEGKVKDMDGTPNDGPENISLLKNNDVLSATQIRDESFEFKMENKRNSPRRSSGTGYREEEKQVETLQLSSFSEDISLPEQNNESISSDLFYWIDAKEQSHLNTVDPGSIILFGKLFNSKSHRFESCCLRVKNAERVCFALPKKNASDAEVIQELNEQCRNEGIEKRRMKFVERFYSFEDNSIPHEKSKWVKLKYPGYYPSFSSKKSWKYIQCVLGSSSSLLELFLLKRKMKGPCFLKVDQMSPVSEKISHCAMEYAVESPRHIHVDLLNHPTPPLRVMSIQLHTELDQNGAQNEIVCVSFAVYNDVCVDQPFPQITSHLYTGLRPTSTDAKIPLDLEKFCEAKRFKVRVFKNERTLLSWLATQIHEVDPDMLVGHNFVGFTLNILLQRFQELHVFEWSSLGRLELKRFPRWQNDSAKNRQDREVCCGRLIVDSYHLSREYYKSTNYKLFSLSKEMKLKGIASGGLLFEPGSSKITAGNWENPKELFDIIVQLCNSAVLSMCITSHLDVVRLTKRLSSIAGNLWSRTLYGPRSERIEYLLLHTFHELKFIVPDRKTFESTKRQRDEGDLDDTVEEGKRKAKYQGGMVLEPKCGLYSDYVLLLDFNSLYPSLIQEFNICFTTVDRWSGSEVEVPPPESLICNSCAKTGSPSPCPHKCILPRVIKSLVDQRREVKRLMGSEKNPNELSLLEIRQKALKLTANSMYGCLGFEYSRFAAQPLAELVTRQGRLALQNAVEMVPQLNPSLRVIYGDTDSVMIQTGIKNDISEVRRIGLSLKSEINKKYQSLEIDIDGVFRSILLLKKKKYAALSVVDWQKDGKVFKEEVKGLDMVRRDWCPLSKKVSDAVLKRILNAEGGEDVLDYIMKYMKSVAENVRSGTVHSLDDFVISKSLTKEPETYKGNSFPHATVALRMRARKDLVRVGDLIPYVICCREEGDSERFQIGDRAFHVDEVRQQQMKLCVDAEWYLASQIYPPVARLCEHIQGFTTTQLNEVMELKGRNQSNTDGTTIMGSNNSMDFSHCSLFKQRPLSECFPTALPLQISCAHCGKKSPVNPHQRIRDIIASKPNDHTSVFELYLCASCGSPLDINYVANCLTLLCHRLLEEFYSSGGSIITVRALRTQLTYFRALFDVPRNPGCPTSIVHAHYNRALRCVAPGERTHYTLAASKADDCLPDDSDNKKFIVDPVFLSIESFYNRIEHLFLCMENLFA